MPQLSIVGVEASCRELVPTARGGLPLCTSYLEGVFSETGSFQLGAFSEG